MLDEKPREPQCIALPTVVLRFGTGRPFLLLLCAIYATIIAALTLVHDRRDTLGLTGREFLGLAFETLACPPFAINLVRKLSLRHRITFDAVAFAFAHFDQTETARFARALTFRLREELATTDAGSPEAVNIQRLCRKLGEHA